MVADRLTSICVTIRATLPADPEVARPRNNRKARRARLQRPSLSGDVGRIVVDEAS